MSDDIGFLAKHGIALFYATIMVGLHYYVGTGAAIVGIAYLAALASGND